MSIASTEADEHAADGSRAPLHAVDWRFLLPSPQSETFDLIVVPGASPAVQRLLAELEVAAEIGTTLPDDGRADAVVIRADDAHDLRSVRQALKPGGVVYLESGRETRMKGWNALRAKVADAGFSGVRSYALAPHPADARVYLPLDTPAALTWYGSAAYDPPTRGRHLARVVLRAFGTVGWRMAAQMLPWYCFTAVAGPSSEADSTPEIVRRTQRAAAIPDEASYPVLLCDTGNRVVMLPFSEKGRRPAALLKIPKVKTVNDRTENEHRAVARLRRRLHERLLESIPEPVALVDHRGIQIGIESYLPGTSLKQLSSEWWRTGPSRIAVLKAAASWLARFHRETMEERIEWNEAARRWVAEPVAAYATHFGTTPAEQALFNRAETYSGKLRDATLPIVWQHRDYNIWNVLMDEGTIRVFDWEGLKTGPPLTDLIHFTTHWYEAAKWANSEQKRLATFRSLWLTATRDKLVRSSRAAIEAYMSDLEVDPRLFPLLLLYTWLELALRRAEQQRDQGVEQSDARKGNSHIAYIQEIAEHAETLFPDE